MRITAATTDPQPASMLGLPSPLIIVTPSTSTSSATTTTTTNNSSSNNNNSYYRADKDDDDYFCFACTGDLVLETGNALRIVSLSPHGSARGT